ncbi:hypothetical protein EGT74_24315 [Chitinophaga lutea]|uniref:Uncharacterized protein n=1 Tax=Chitinophaga lutea TaxID=2488634 RepID=A0A3N4PA44_9BACT|nr:hypothetical protein [Chitinophaga lutea]RPE05512.1 hypothetical protein EGT74_24315 [Chitinophaga lutea]
MQNDILFNLMENSDFQVKCYGEYMELSKKADRLANESTWKVFKAIHSGHADFLRQTAQAHLDKHLEIENKIRVQTNSQIMVSAHGLIDLQDILGL